MLGTRLLANDPRKLRSNFQRGVSRDEPTRSEATKSYFLSPVSAVKFLDREITSGFISVNSPLLDT